MDKVKQLCNKYYDYLILTAIYGLLHIFIHTDYWDDAGMSAILTSYEYNLPAYLITTWNSWSSALILHAVEVIVEALPNYIWKALDVVMIVVLYHYFVQVINQLTSHVSAFTPHPYTNLE